MINRLTMGLFVLAMLTSLAPFARAEEKPKPPTKIEIIQTNVIDKLPVLKNARGERLPMYVWPISDIDPTDEAVAQKLIDDLAARGFAVFMSWHPGNAKSNADCLKVAAMLHKAKVPVAINATELLGGFSDKSTAHLDVEGKEFFDPSQTFIQLGCPFRMTDKVESMKEKTDAMTKAYADAGVPIDFVFADFEFDGPLEWGGGWEASKKCKVCREHIKNIDDFKEYQKAVRAVRGELQQKIYADPILKAFPKALVGNYGVYPNDGFRYWYDFFEKAPPEGAPTKPEGKAKMRGWFQEWPLTHYTYAMPVVFPRYAMFDWYDFKDPDFRWMRGLLVNADNAGQSTDPKVPIISFTKYFMTDTPPKLDVWAGAQMSEAAYKEFLWHSLLRGHDDFIIFCGDTELTKEAELLQAVYDESLGVQEFLDKGEPITFDLPEKPGPIVSGLKMGEKVLVRRSDFGEKSADAIEVRAGDKTISVKEEPGKNQMIELK